MKEDPRVIRARNECLGKVFKLKNNREATIVKYDGAYDITLKFDDDEIKEKVNMHHIKTGNVDHPNFRNEKCNIFGIGSIGIGKHISRTKDGETIKKYTCWVHILERVFSKPFHEKCPTYKGCSVSKLWINYQIFGDWYDENYVDGWHLDKDILFKGNKSYSPEKCCFVPQEINKLFVKADAIRGKYPIGVKSKDGKKFYVAVNTGKNYIAFSGFGSAETAFEAYKEKKEDYIKEVAEK
jgi:hypothetical protein